MGIRLLIIGGVAGGASAAARARRLSETAEIILFERDEYISYASCGLPYYIGQVIKERSNLFITSPALMRERFNIDVRTGCEVLRIDKDQKRIYVRDLKTGQEYTEPYDKLILSPGARPVKPKIEGIDLGTIFTLRNIDDSDRIQKFIESNLPQKAAIIGGGFIGLEMAENLAGRGIQVTIVEMLPQILPPIDIEMAEIVQGYLKEKGLELRLSERVTAFDKRGRQTVVHTESGQEIPCDMVILSAGIRPENQLAKEAGLQIGETGGIRVDEYLQTSDPDIFAVGDAIEIADYVTGADKLTPLAGPANKQGRIAADNALGRQSIYRGTQGTAIVKIFDLTAASTGNNEKGLKNRNRPYRVSYTYSGSHAAYYPGAQTLVIKLIFSPDSGKILGAQIIGGVGVDKRIDVIATAIRAKMTVFDLEELELAYSPQFSSAKDPVNMAGFVAANILRGDLEVVTCHEIDSLNPETYQLIDLRTGMEIAASGQFPGSLHIPLHQLRQRLNELDPSKIYVPYCAIGLRGYIAHRILVQNGFKSRNLSGGYRLYQRRLA